MLDDVAEMVESNKDAGAGKAAERSPLGEKDSESESERREMKRESERERESEKQREKR